MPRGGRHENTIKPKWESGQTCTVRIPIAKKKEILAIAKALDKIEGEWNLIEKEKYQIVINLLVESLDFSKSNGSKYRNQIIKVLNLLGEDYPERSTRRSVVQPK